MSPAKLALACVLAAALLCACGTAAKPPAGSGDLLSKPGTYAKVDDPRTVHMPCLEHSGLPAIREFRAPGNLPAIQIGSPPAGPTAVFYPTPGVAQGMQISDPQAQGAEVIGNALLYVNQASDRVLSKVESCLAIDVLN